MGRDRGRCRCHVGPLVDRYRAGILLLCGVTAALQDALTLVEVVVLRAVAVFCAVVGSAMAQAEVLELEGTIELVDTAMREITIGRKTLDVAKKCRITIDGKEGEVGDLKPDQEAKVEYVDELEVATKITVTGERQLSVPTIDAELSPEEQKLVGDWKAASGKEGKSFDATRIVREWDSEGKEFNRGVWLARKDGSFLAVLRNKWSLEGKIVDDDMIEFTVYNAQHRIVEKLLMPERPPRMNRVTHGESDIVPKAIAGVYDIEWTEPSGNNGTVNYELKDDGTFIRAGKPAGKWELADGVIQIRFDDVARGFAIVRFRSPDGLEGTHTKGDGTKSQWKGKKSK
jgi:hypothetical protein